MPLPPPTSLTLPPKGKTAYYGEDDDIVYRLLDGEKPQAFSAVTLDWKPYRDLPGRIVLGDFLYDITEEEANRRIAERRRKGRVVLPSGWDQYDDEGYPLKQ